MKKKGPEKGELIEKEMEKRQMERKVAKKKSDRCRRRGWRRES